MHLKNKNKLFKLISIIIAAAIILSTAGSIAAPSNEIPEAVYSGVGNSSIILKNLDFTDIKSSVASIKEAIYETGALDIMKNYGDKQFGLKKTLTREQVIALVLSAVGREAEAQVLGETRNNARAADQKKTDALSILADGFLEIARNDGLITAVDFNNAMLADQTTLEAGAFNRAAAAQRQELAVWLAKALKMAPLYSQQKIFNSYSDWKSADADKIPYIEAILQNNIMSGDNNGKFNPRQLVTKEQAVQVLKNAVNLIMPLKSLERKSGTVESIIGSKDLSQGMNTMINTFNIRNVNGKLHQIVVRKSADSSGAYTNEQSGVPAAGAEKDLIVYKDGKIGKSSLLKEGDRIEYTIAPDFTIRYAKVISSVYDTKYVAAQINTIDTANSTMNISPLLKLDYPIINLAKEDIPMNPDNGQAEETYRYSGNVSVFLNGKKADVQKIQPGTVVQLTLKNNVISDIRTFDFQSGGEGGIVKGVVEDNNPQLGYITLYNEDGTGNTPFSVQSLIANRTYNYGNPNDIAVLKNQKKAKIDDIDVGDTAFLKLDDDGNVISVSAVDNYVSKYGRVISKRASSMVVRYDDGTQQVLSIETNTNIVEDGKLVKSSNIKDGDRVKLLLHITNKFTRLKEVTLEGDENYITNIYKGTFSELDDMSNSLDTKDLWLLNNGQWERVGSKGYKFIKLSEDYSIYNGERKLDIDEANKYMVGSETYIAVKKDYDGKEKAVLISFRNEEDKEVPYDDNIAGVSAGGDSFALSKSSDDIKLSPGTIVVKDGRLVNGTSIQNGDTAYVMANRDNDSGDLNAGIVHINPRQENGQYTIYRGRIKSIKDNNEFTVESFSQLNGTLWNYNNTPKTFKITSGTQILNDSGVVSQRDFVSYGSDSYAGRTVYILGDGLNAVMVNTAPYGAYSAKGDVYQITGGTIGEEGTVTQEPTGLTLKNAKIYNSSSHLWVDSKDMTLTLLKNTIILKDRKIAKPSDLKKGDKLRVIKKDEKETGDAYIIIVEG